MSEDRAASTLPPQPQYVPGRMVSGLAVPQAAPVNLDGQPVPAVATGAAPAPAPTAPIRTPAANGADRSAYAPWTTDQLADYFVQNKALALTPDQARGVARWLHDRESKGDPFAYNSAGGGAGAFGLEQARGPRLQRMVALYGPTPTTQQEVDFAIHEFVTSEKGALQAIKNSSSEQAAYDAMGAKFERPGGTPPGLLQAGASPDYSHIVARSQQVADQESAEIKRLTAAADQADPGSQERHRRLQQAMDRSERLSKTFEDMAKHPPTETPIDMMQNFGSLATVIALAGGLLAKRPLTAALNAAGSAMRAQQENNHEQFQRSYKQWQDQTDLISKALNFQNQEINQIMEDRRISETERHDKISDHLRLYDMQQALDQWNLGNQVEVYKLLQSLPKAQADLDRIKAATGEAKAKQDYYERGGAGGKAPRFGTPDDLMQRWHDDFVQKNNREPTLDETAQQRSQFLEEGRPAGQTSQNVAERIMIGANDVSKTLDALTALPGGVTLGIFGGAQAALGTDMTDNLRKSLANAAVPESAQVLRALSNGASRALATLSSAGSAQGVQALSEQLKADFPEANDSGLTVASKMADIRQITEAALEVLQTDRRLSKEQRTQVTDILGKVQKAVPFTTRDVALLVDRGNPERFAQFAQKLGLGKEQSLEVTQEQYDKLPSGSAYTMPGDATVRYKQ